MNKKVKFLTWAAVIAAAYTVLTCIFAFAASGVVQVRVSEMLCILPAFSSAGIPGVTLGCLLSNLLTGCAPWDILFGTLATIIGAVGTYLLRKNKILALLPPIISNTLIIPHVLKYVYNVHDAVPFLMMTVGAGEIISVGVLGGLLSHVLSKNKMFI